MSDAIDITKFNETDVREEIVAPLIRALGYRSGTTNDVIRELNLRYGRDQLGHKKPQKDPLLRGKIDYMLIAEGRVAWVIEAKAPSVTIGDEERIQAYTYARHPEVGAVYFVLCNGHWLEVHQTDQWPRSKPVATIAYSDFVENPANLAGILGPAALIKNFPEVTVAVGPPLGLGLRSVERVASGSITYHTEVRELAPLNELMISIVDGNLQRDERGCLLAQITTRAPSQTMQEFIERMGLETIELQSADSVLSSDAAAPSVFVYTGDIIFPKGSTLIDFNTWQPIVLPTDLHIAVAWTARVAIVGRKLQGAIVNRMVFEGNAAIEIPGHVEITLV